MDFLIVNFPVAGFSTYFFIPPLVTFFISFFSSMAGLSGAFLLMPFQISILGFTSISVTSTNFLFNVVGIPGGVFRYISEKRMLWPLAGAMAIGTFPGVLAGYYIRVTYFPDPSLFKFFVALVLIFMATRLALSFRNSPRHKAPAKDCRMTNVSWNLTRISVEFMNRTVSVNTLLIFIFALFVGVIGGIYGIGGGALLAPVCISMLDMPVYTVAGASLLSTLITSVAGVVIYSFLPIHNGFTAPPDWLLGFLFGLGGLAGMYFGAKCQRYVPESVIKCTLALILLFISTRYIWQFFT